MVVLARHPCVSSGWDIPVPSAVVPGQMAVLRPLRDGDGEGVYECYALNGSDGAWSLDEARRWVGWQRQQECLGLAQTVVIACPRTDAYIGHVIIDFNRPPNQCHASVGVWIDPAHHRRGMGTMAVRAVVDHLWQRHPGLLRLDAICGVDNIPARRLLARVGFIPLAVLHGQQVLRGRPVDMDLWSLRRGMSPV